MLFYQPKYIAACALFLMGSCCVSCYKSTANDSDPIIDPDGGGGQESPLSKSKLIVFSDFSVTKMEMAINEQSSRSVDAEEEKPLNHLLVADVVDDKVVYLYESHNAENHDALSKPVTIDMSYGKHDLYFLCSENLWDEFDLHNLTLQWNADCQILKDVWFKHVALEVTEATDTPRSVKLERCVSYLRFTIDDALPATVKALRLQVDGGSWTYDFRNRCGAAKSLVTREVGVPDSYIGKSGVSTGIYTFVPDDCISASRFDVLALDAAGNTVGSFSATTVPIKVNRYTPYNGTMFE